MKYQRRQFQIKRQLHWGQLKLLMSEIEFLLTARKMFPDKAKIKFVYVGAAPGHHINYLHKIFPETDFILYDPHKFAIKPADWCEIHTGEDGFFTNDKAIELKSRLSEEKNPIVFCSDIRSEPADEKAVANDMEWQKEWWKTLTPDFAMFKFRLPWSPGKTEYMDGDIYTQMFQGPTSTETRLMVKKGAQMILYDNTEYEERLMYHNNVVRNTKFFINEKAKSKPLMLATNRICNCYDCQSLMLVIRNYLGKTTTKKIIEKIKELEHETMHNNYTIRSLTIEYHNEIMEIFQRCQWADCRNKKCPICPAGGKWKFGKTDDN